MKDQQEKNSTLPSDEIDLGKLLQLLRKGLKRLFVIILRFFLFFKRNAIKLGTLIFIGLAIGLLLNTFVKRKLKIDIIVKPNFESKDYLYDVVDEIQANLSSRDTLFFNSIGLDVNELKGFDINVEPIEEIELDEKKGKEDIDYLELLEKYQENDFVLDIVKSEIGKKVALTHRITITYKNQAEGASYARKLIDYINSNPYFSELRKVSVKNASFRIAKNQEQIEQIDALILNYTNEFSEQNSSIDKEGVVFFENQKTVDATGLLSLKNKLVEEIEKKQLEVSEQNNPISIINFGKTQAMSHPILKNGILLFPGILLFLFFLWSFLRFVDRKAKELL